MSNEADSANQSPISGTMLLYRQPELLAKEDHGHLGLRSVANPFEFARHVRAIPLVFGEFRSAQKYYPIVFTGTENPIPLAVVGIDEDLNLFVDDAGKWTVPGYIPAYLRCYPFTLATAAEDRYAVILDRAADVVSEQPEVALYEGEALSAAIQERLELCRSYEAEKQRTKEFCATLVRLGLLVPQQATQLVNGQERTIARYHAVDQDQLQLLAPETVAELFGDGSLAAILAHLFSLDNFSELMRLQGLPAAVAP